MDNRRHDIERYRSGRMSPGEMHRFEKKALDDPFLSEALEGAETISPAEFSEDVASLRDTAAKRHNLPGHSWWRWPSRIAAAAAVLVVTGYLIGRYLDANEPGARELALEKKENTPPEPARAAQDSAQNNAAAPSVREVPRVEDRSIRGAARQESDAEPAHVIEVPQHQGDHQTAQEPDLTLADTAPDTTLGSTQGIASDDETVHFRRLDLAAKEPASGAAVPEKVMPAEADRSPTGASEIHGVVMAEGRPVPGVNVLAKGGTTGTVTNSKGEYELALANNQDELVFSFIGYQTMEVATRGKSQIDVELVPDVSALSEVVVTGYGVSGGPATITPTFEPASPEGGQKSFREYLEQQYRYPEEARDNDVEGRITVQFYVEMDGSPAGFEILKGLGYGCDEELIRIIRDGPRWIPSKLNGIATRELVKVRFRVTVNSKE